MQKLSGERIGAGRHFGKCGRAFDPAKGTPKGQPFARADGNLSGEDGGRKTTSGSFCRFLLFSGITDILIKERNKQP
jgi:hypothetical protein